VTYPRLSGLPEAEIFLASLQKGSGGAVRAIPARRDLAKASRA
jgi:hypothetical protein